MIASPPLRDDCHIADLWTWALLHSVKAWPPLFYRWAAIARD
jgi:hypothetical protein